MISRDVSFFESKFPFREKSKQDDVMQTDNTIIREDNEDFEEQNDEEMKRWRDQKKALKGKITTLDRHYLNQRTRQSIEEMKKVKKMGKQ